MKQKEAVYLAITQVLALANIDFEDGMDVKPLLTKELRAQVNGILFESFKAGKVDYAGELPDDSGLKEYISGLTSNWVRKDTRFNGNTKYMPKNPGSRAGQGDEQLKNLKLYLATKTDPADRAEVQKYIDARIAELAAAKAKTIPTFNVSMLPEVLRSKFGIN
jgi:hypothetical protein